MAVGMASDCGLYDAVDVPLTVISRVVDPCRLVVSFDIAVILGHRQAVFRSCQPWVAEPEGGYAQ